MSEEQQNVEEAPEGTSATGPGSDRPGAQTGTTGREQPTEFDKTRAAEDQNEGLAPASPTENTGQG